MTQVSATARSKAVPDAEGGWLYGRAADLLLGAGGGYLLSIPLLLWWSHSAGVQSWSILLGALLALLVSGPHYGATILRVYEQREDRRKYAIFAVWATLALCALFVVGLNHAFVGSLLVTTYATWSPWHFSGQNYGVALMFLRRRGVEIEPRAKQMLYASFLLSFVLAALVLHGQRYTASVASVPVSATSVFRILSLGLPYDFVRVAVPVTGLAYLTSLVWSGALLLRHARPAELAPAACLVLVQALWFVVPAAVPVFFDAPLRGLAFSVVWVSAAHAAQYLWVTSFYARKADPSLSLTPYLAHALLAGSMVTVVPALIFAPGLLGSVPWDVGLAILLFSVVNLHHFILDGAVWKLRDGRVARLLLREGASRDRPDPAGARSPWFRPAVALLGVVSLGVAGLDLFEREFVINRAGDDLERVLRSSQRLAWIGRDNPPLHTQVGDLLASRRQLDAAMAEYHRSLELYPTAPAWIGIGRIHANQARWLEASDAFAKASALDPEDVTAAAFAGRAWLEVGRPDRARASLERAVALAPGSEELEHELARAIEAERDLP